MKTLTEIFHELYEKGIYISCQDRDKFREIEAELNRLKTGIKTCEGTMIVDGGDMFDHGWKLQVDSNKERHILKTDLRSAYSVLFKVLNDPVFRGGGMSSYRGTNGMGLYREVEAEVEKLKQHVQYDTVNVPPEPKPEEKKPSEWKGKVMEFSYAPDTVKVFGDWVMLEKWMINYGLKLQKGDKIQHKEAKLGDWLPVLMGLNPKPYFDTYFYKRHIQDWNNSPIGRQFPVMSGLTNFVRAGGTIVHLPSTVDISKESIERFERNHK